MWRKKDVHLNEGHHTNAFLIVPVSQKSQNSSLSIVPASHCTTHARTSDKVCEWGGYIATTPVPSGKCAGRADVHWHVCCVISISSVSPVWIVMVDTGMNAQSYQCLFLCRCVCPIGCPHTNLVRRRYEPAAWAMQALRWRRPLGLSGLQVRWLLLQHTRKSIDRSKRDQQHPAGTVCALSCTYVPLTYLTR